MPTTNCLFAHESDVRMGSLHMCQKLRARGSVERQEESATLDIFRKINLSSFEKCFRLMMNDDVSLLSNCLKSRL